MSEQLIKSAKRVKEHGEVFTPQWMVDKMLDVEEVRESIENIHATFLEPSAGEGVFLMTILARKLDNVKERYADTLEQYEQYALYALTTLYGVELLRDNLNLCRQNLLAIFTKHYMEQAEHFKKKVKPAIIKNVYAILNINIVQGNFLTRQTDLDGPIVFSEWTLLTNIDKEKPPKTLRITRTDYTLDDIHEQVEHETGYVYGYTDERHPYYYQEVRVNQIYKLEVVLRERREGTE